MSRVFSELEKRIIKSLLDLDSRKGLNVIGNIIDDYLSDIYFLRVNSKTDVALMLKEEYLGQVDLNSINSNVSDLLITFVVLFEYLKNERYIYFTGKYEFNSLGVEFAGERYIHCDFIDDDLKALVHKYTTQKFFITESFKEFVLDGYKTKEEVTKERELDLSNKELVYTRVALGVTFLGLIASVLVPLLSTTSVKLENDLINISSSKATIKYIDGRLNEQVAANKDITKEINQSISILNTKVDNAFSTIENINEHDIKLIKSDLKKIESEVNNTSLIVSEIVDKTQIQKKKET